MAHIKIHTASQKQRQYPPILVLRQATQLRLPSLLSLSNFTLIEQPLSLHLSYPSRLFCCIWHSEPPDPYFLPSGPGCLRLCSLPALILPQRPHLLGNSEMICVWTLSSHFWGLSRFSPGSPPLCVHQLSRLRHSLPWLLLPQLCWWHLTNPLFSPIWNTGSSTNLCLTDISQWISAHHLKLT